MELRSYERGTGSPPNECAEIASIVRLDRARDVSVAFGKQRVLSGDQLSIDRGQTVAIIGESGCGKTVFMKTIIGLMQADRGTIAVRRP